DGRTSSHENLELNGRTSAVETILPEAGAGGARTARLAARHVIEVPTVGIAAMYRLISLLGAIRVERVLLAVRLRRTTAAAASSAASASSAAATTTAARLLLERDVDALARPVDLERL